MNTPQQTTGEDIEAALKKLAEDIYAKHRVRLDFVDFGWICCDSVAGTTYIISHCNASIATP